MTKTAIIYARVSDRKQVEGEISIPAQLEHGRRKANELGATVLREFVDGGKTGRSVTARDAFRAALEYCEIRGVDLFICWSSSRFARNKVDAVLSKHRLDEVGTKLIYLSLAVDRDSEFGRMMDGLLELFDEHKSVQTSMDTRRSLIRNAEMGYWNGGCAPFGYRPVAAPDNPKRRRLEPHPEEAGLVREIFQMRAQNLMGARAIARVLNDRGSTNRGRRWNKTVIHYLLHSEAVLGRLIFNRKDRHTGRQRPREDWIIVQSHRPIIGAELWEAVQKRVREDAPTSQAGSAHNSTFLFTGLLRCECGAPMQIESATGRNRRYYYYTCRAATLERTHKVRRIAARELETWLAAQIQEEALSADRLHGVVDELAQVCSAWAKKQGAARSAVLRQMRSVEAAQSNLYKLLEAHGPDTPNLGDLTRRLRENNAELQRLGGEIAVIDAAEAPAPAVSPDEVEALRESILQVLDQTKDPRRVRAFYSDFIVAIKLGPMLSIEYDPAKFVMAPGGAVHSKVEWLPEPDLPRTRVVTIAMPPGLVRSAA